MVYRETVDETTFGLIQDLQDKDYLMASLEDIGAMKLNAIINSGERLKDFVDVYFLLETLPLQRLLDAFSVKYTQGNPMLAMKALTYFEDINNEPIQWMHRTVDITKIQARLVEAAQHGCTTNCRFQTRHSGSTRAIAKCAIRNLLL